MRILLLLAALLAALFVSHAAWAGGHKQGTLVGAVNLNQADEAALDLLPGVGETRAQAIIAWRRAHPFKKVEELTRVKGIGRKTILRLRPYLTLSGPTTLRLQEAPEAAK